MAALDRYLHRQRHFSSLDSDGDEQVFWQSEYITQVSPWQWWSQFNTLEPKLAALAIRVLQIGIASSACERLFSKWGYILSKYREYRTRLAIKRQHMLVYLFSNWRMLEGSGEDKWYRSDSDDEEEELED